MLENLSECDGVVTLIDDLLMYGQTVEEPHRRLITALGKLKREGMILNKGKYQFYATKISFFGHIVSPDPEKT